MAEDLYTAVEGELLMVSTPLKPIIHHLHKRDKTRNWKQTFFRIYFDEDNYQNEQQWCDDNNRQDPLALSLTAVAAPIYTDNKNTHPREMNK